MRHALIAPVLLLLVSASEAAIRPEQFHTAEPRKTNFYVRDGVFVGGDRTVSDIIVRDIRRATNSGFERIVVDLESSRDGDRIAIERPSYYQVAVSPEERRLVFTLWGQPRLAFDATKVARSFKKSKAASRLELFPLLEEQSWTFAVSLREGHEVEVFELKNPVRVIVDIKPIAGSSRSKKK